MKVYYKFTNLNTLYDTIQILVSKQDICTTSNKKYTVESTSH